MKRILWYFYIRCSICRLLLKLTHTEKHRCEIILYCNIHTKKQCVWLSYYTRWILHTNTYIYICVYMYRAASSMRILETWNIYSVPPRINLKIYIYKRYLCVQWSYKPNTVMTNYFLSYKNKFPLVCKWMNFHLLTATHHLKSFLRMRKFIFMQQLFTNAKILHIFYTI